MDIEGTYLFQAPIKQVWDMLPDPEVLTKTLPGIEQIRLVGPDTYEATIRLAIAAAKGTYTGKIVILEKQAPHFYRLQAQGSGIDSLINAEGRVELAQRAGNTSLTYKGTAQFGGALVGINQRILAGVAKMLMNQFFGTFAVELLARQRQLVQSPQTAAGATSHLPLICPRCNTANMPGASFCNNCGRQLGRNVSLAPPVPPVPQQTESPAAPPAPGVPGYTTRPELPAAPRASPRATERPIPCPHCGLPLGAGTKVCPRCGSDILYAQTRLWAGGRGSTSRPIASPGTADLAQLLPRDSYGRLLPGAELQHARYRIEQVLPAGGMGAVYRAFDKNLGHACAVKEMLERFHRPEDRQHALEWFEREARMLLSLHHPAIPRIYDRFAQDGHHYLIMDFIEGRTLDEVLRQHGQPQGLPEARVRGWAIQLCEVLAYLHSRKPQPVIFRDLKPANIMLTRDDEMKLIDFGIARLFQQGGQATEIWTQGYAPPEQRLGNPQPQSDLYALGATLHRLLTCHEALDNTPSIFDFPPVRRLRPEISPHFEAVIAKAVQKRLEDRWLDAREMGEALRALPGER